MAGQLVKQCGVCFVPWWRYLDMLLGLRRRPLLRYLPTPTPGDPSWIAYYWAL
jgi:hypothetical protein